MLKHINTVKHLSNFMLYYVYLLSRLLGHECNPSMMAGSLRHHLVGSGKDGNHDDMVAQQSKDAIIYVTVSTLLQTINYKCSIRCISWYTYIYNVYTITSQAS